MSHIQSPVTFDTRAYLLGGRPTWLLSGEQHYFKMTRGDWRRRLVQMRCAGFNTVSVYMPWNYHELAEGDWHFNDDRDVAYYLELAAELGIYVIARPGPYICNEWHAGGLPAWLCARPGIRPRTDDPQFLHAVDRWWDRICPIICDFQYDSGGTVILAQIENEYGHYGEGQQPSYIYHLRDGMRARGITVPLINCDSFINFARLKPGVYEGVNLCANFGGDALRNLARARSLQPDAPLFVTEYWIAAFDWWGRHGSAIYDAARAVNGALEITAGGAGGLNAFVFAGGAHFGYWHGRSICSDANFMTTLYGPGAPILDDGRFDAKYQLFKNHVSPLCCDELARADMPEITTLDIGIQKAIRRGPQAVFSFYQNQSPEQRCVADQEKDQACVDMSIPAGAIQWTVHGLPVAAGCRLMHTNLHLFRSEPALILFGTASMDFTVTLTDAAGQPLTLAGTVPDGMAPLLLHAGALDVLVLSEEGIERCWTVALPDAVPAVFGGPERIEDLAVADGRLQATISSPTRAACWSLRNHTIVPLAPAYRAMAPDAEIALRDICVSRELPEALPTYDDAAWQHAVQPLPMACFGHGHGYAWYRARVTVEHAGPQMIYLSGADDRAHVWVDGIYLGVRGWGSNKGWHLMPNLTPGEHTVSLLLENLGMFNSGAEFDIPLGEPKGLYGPVWLNGAEVTGWRMRAGLGGGEGLDTWAAPGNGGWEPADDTEVRGPAWVSATFDMPEHADGAIRLDLAAAGKGTVWLNGRNIGRYWKLGPQQSLWLPLSWLQPRNTLVIFEEAQIAPAQVRVTFASFGAQATLVF
jgi:hypothetical protein